MDRVARFRGSLLGLALGDALGAPFESRPIEVVRERVRSANHLRHDPPAMVLRYTDDTQMAVALAEALVGFDEPSAAHYAAAYVSNYESWRGYGGGARKVLKALRDGVAVEQAPRIAFPDGSYANGAAMRVAPVGLVFADNPAGLAHHARHSALPTHCHPQGIEGALVIAAAVAWAYRTADDPFDPVAFWSAVEPHVQSDGFRERFELAKQAESVDDLAGIGNGVSAQDSVFTALACFAIAPDDFVSAVGEGVRLGGDCDTIAAMAGAVSGARLGDSVLPRVWLERLENGAKGRDYIVSIATRLAAKQ